jgi:1D-myo-inositol 3-kinase
MRSRARVRFGADYTTIGHVTVDVLEDGSTRPGGSAFYSALQASRLGRRARIVTRGVPRQIEGLLEPYAAELELVVLPAAETTTLATRGRDLDRRQRLLAWAGEISADIELETEILHLAPVARELPARWHGRHGFVGLTPQGLLRRWASPPADVSLHQADAGALALARRSDALVVGAEERPFCHELIDAALARGAVVAVTDGPRPNVVLEPGGGESRVEVAALASEGDDLGLGDVYAAAFFIALAGGEPPLSAAAMGNAAAALRMQGTGPASIGAPAPPAPGR